MEYENDVQIDVTILETEWLNQPALAIKYSTYWAKCDTILKQTEENIKLIRAKLIQEVTSDPESCLGEGMKATGPVIESYYRSHKKHIKAKEEWITALHAANIADIVKKEISVTRKAALVNLVTLFGLNYFAGPNAPRDVSQIQFNQQKQNISDKKVSKKMKRKNKE